MRTGFPLSSISWSMNQVCEQLWCKLSRTLYFILLYIYMFLFPQDNITVGIEGPCPLKQPPIFITLKPLFSSTWPSLEHHCSCLPHPIIYFKLYKWFGTNVPFPCALQSSSITSKLTFLTLKIPWFDSFPFLILWTCRSSFAESLSLNFVSPRQYFLSKFFNLALNCFNQLLYLPLSPI